MLGTAAERPVGMTVRSVDTGGRENVYVQCEPCESWFHLFCTSLPREVYPFLSVSENQSLKIDKCLKSDLKATMLEEVKENLISVISDTLTQELSKTLQDSPSRVKAFASNIETQKALFDKRKITGIRIRGLPEQTGADAEKLEKVKSAIEDVLTHIGVPARIVDVKRVRKPTDQLARPLIFDVDSVWHKKMILLSLVKLILYSQNLFISREPIALERETENESLK